MRLRDRDGQAEARRWYKPWTHETCGTGYCRDRARGRWIRCLCPELDIASQGDSIEEAKANLEEALSLFFEAASPTEVAERLHPEVYVTALDIAVG
jgi:predicted RNase H-like HicB family nuclease